MKRGIWICGEWLNQDTTPQAMLSGSVFTCELNIKGDVTETFFLEMKTLDSNFYWNQVMFLLNYKRVL